MEPQHTQSCNDWPNHAQGRLNAYMTDADLIKRLQAGESAALGEIYDRYASLVYGLSLRILGSPQEAEDLTQEMFLKLYQGGTYNPNRGSLGSYLTTMTRSRAIDRLRTRSNRRQILTRWQHDMSKTGDRPVEHVLIEERRAQVQGALAQLSDVQRQVLELSYYEGLSQSEIAKRLQKPLGTVKSWARKGLLSLRDQLKDGAHDV